MVIQKTLPKTHTFTDNDEIFSPVCLFPFCKNFNLEKIVHFDQQSCTLLNEAFLFLITC